jgi:hypothetical protein
MRAVYQILDKIKDKLRTSPNIQTVSFGNIMEVDLNKTTLYPLAHIGMGDVSLQDHKIEVTINLLLLDIVDDNRDPSTEDEFYGNSNLQDILNTMLAEANILISDLRRGSSFDELYQVDTDITARPFLDRFENQLAGWGVDLVISFPNNDVSIC